MIVAMFFFFTFIKGIAHLKMKIVVPNPYYSVLLSIILKCYNSFAWETDWNLSFVFHRKKEIFLGLEWMGLKRNEAE